MAATNGEWIDLVVIIISVNSNSSTMNDGRRIYLMTISQNIFFISFPTTAHVQENNNNNITNDPNNIRLINFKVQLRLLLTVVVAIQYVQSGAGHMICVK